MGTLVKALSRAWRGLQAPAWAGEWHQGAAAGTGSLCWHLGKAGCLSKCLRTRLRGYLGTLQFEKCDLWFFPEFCINAINLVFILVKLSRLTSSLYLWPWTTEVIKNECHEKTFNCSCALSSISLKGQQDCFVDVILHDQSSSGFMLGIQYFH